jgi:hypothetical protein
VARAVPDGWEGPTFAPPFAWEPAPRLENLHRRMTSYEHDGLFVTLITDGKVTIGERQAVCDAIRSDPNVPNGSYLIIDMRQCQVQLTQAELQERVRSVLESLTEKIGVACAIIVQDKSLRIGLGFQLIAGKMNFRVGVFRDDATARRWIAP